MKKLLSILFLTVLTTAFSFAANINWNGGAGTLDWGTGGNWVGGVKPGSGDYAVLSGVNVTISTTETIQGVRVINGSLTITASGNLTCDGSTAFPGIYGQGDVTNSGVITIANINHAGIQMTDKVFVNDGTIDISNTAQAGIKLTGTGIFNNNDAITINSNSSGNGHGLHLESATSSYNNNSGASLSIGNSGSIAARGIFCSGTIVSSSGASIELNNISNAAIQNASGALFTNGGSLSIGVSTACSHHGIFNLSSFTNTGDITFGTVNFSHLENNSGSTFDNSGTISLTSNAGKSINSNGSALVTNTGTIEGEGQISGAPANFSNSGILSPGFSPGTMTFQNGFDNGTLNVELASTSSFDELIFTGGSSSDYAIGGTLNVSLDGYTPAIGETFQIITAAPGYTGTFSTINYPLLPSDWTIQYNPSDITLEYLGISLPVSLIDFTASLTEKTVALKWSTAMEVNNAGFVLQRSLEGVEWKDLSWIESYESTSTREQQYDYVDEEPAAGMNYYRLIQKDLDGRLTMFSAVVVKLDQDVSQIEIYPNPVLERLLVKYTDSDYLKSIKIYNVKGEQMMIITESVSSIDVSTLPAGSYWVEINNGTEVNTHKIIKL